LVVLAFFIIKFVFNENDINYSNNNNSKINTAVAFGNKPDNSANENIKNSNQSIMSEQSISTPSVKGNTSNNKISLVTTTVDKSDKIINTSVKTFATDNVETTTNPTQEINKDIQHADRIFSGNQILKIENVKSGSDIILSSSELNINSTHSIKSSGTTSISIKAMSKGTINITIKNSGTAYYQGIITVRKYGDVDDNGKINTTDQSYITKHITNAITLNGDDYTSADVNADGTINNTDQSLIDDYIFGLIDYFPSEN